MNILKIIDNKKLPLNILILFIIMLIVSFIKPYSLGICFAESTPAVIGATVLLLTYKKFKFTNFTYILWFILSIFILIGAHFSYAKMPLFNWLKVVFHLHRNHYDRLGHFMQGLIPSIIIREILLRKTKLKRGKVLNLIIICICLAISASYELIEWAIVLITKIEPEIVLSTQGDIWDTQWDMLCALLGSILGLITLSKIHDKILMNTSIKML